MKKLIPSLIVALLSTQSVAAAAKYNHEQSCFSGDVDLCSIAKAMELQIGPGLPLVLNEIISMKSISSHHTSVGITLSLDAEKGATLRSALKEAGEEKTNKIKDVVSQRITRDACNSEAMKGFVNNGGRVDYRFEYHDGELFSLIKLSQCN